MTVGVRQQGEIVGGLGSRPGHRHDAREYAAVVHQILSRDNAETRSIGGSGLGLALVKAIVEAHGGRVWIKSVFGQGSTFLFTLPVAEHGPHVTPAPEPHLENHRDGAGGTQPVYTSLLSEHMEDIVPSVATTSEVRQKCAVTSYLPNNTCTMAVSTASVSIWCLWYSCCSEPVSPSSRPQGVSAGRGTGLQAMPVSMDGHREA